MVRTASYLAFVAVLASSTLAKEMEPDAARAAELYDSGIVHERLMNMKMVRAVTCTPSRALV